MFLSIVEGLSIVSKPVWDSDSIKTARCIYFRERYVSGFLCVQRVRERYVPYNPGTGDRLPETVHINTCVHCLPETGKNNTGISPGKKVYHE